MSLRGETAGIILVLGLLWPVHQALGAPSTLQIPPELAFPPSDRAVCIPQSPTQQEISKAEGAASSTRKVTLEEGKDYQVTAGLAVEQNSCVKKFGLAPFKRAIVQGMACLRRLKSPAARANADKIAQLFKDKLNPPKIECNEAAHEWEDALAYSTLPGEANYPNISIIPSYDPKTAQETPESTVFHELFHFLGYVHRTPNSDHASIEYPYACSDCCFGPKKSPRARSLGCKICKGAYSNPDSKEYLGDLFTFFADEGRPEMGVHALDAHLLQSPDDRETSINMFLIMKHQMSAIADAYAGAIEKRLAPLTKDERKKLSGEKRVEGDTAFYDSERPLGEAYADIIGGHLDAAEAKLGQFKMIGIDKMPSYARDRETYSSFTYTAEEFRKRCAAMLYDVYDKKAKQAGDPQTKKSYEDAALRVFRKFLKQPS